MSCDIFGKVCENDYEICVLDGNRKLGKGTCQDKNSAGLYPYLKKNVVYAENQRTISGLQKALKVENSHNSIEFSMMVLKRLGGEFNLKTLDDKLDFIVGKRKGGIFSNPDDNHFIMNLYELVLRYASVGNLSYIIKRFDMDGVKRGVEITFQSTFWTTISVNGNLDIVFIQRYLKFLDLRVVSIYNHRITFSWVIQGIKDGKIPNFFSKISWLDVCARPDSDYEYISVKTFVDVIRNLREMDVENRLEWDKVYWLGLAGLTKTNSITWDIVLNNPNIEFNAFCLSQNGNISWDIVESNPEIEWNYTEIFKRMPYLTSSNVKTAISRFAWKINEERLSVASKIGRLDRIPETDENIPEREELYGVIETLNKNINDLETQLRFLLNEAVWQPFITLTDIENNLEKYWKNNPMVLRNPNITLEKMETDEFLMRFFPKTLLFEEDYLENFCLNKSTTMDDLILLEEFTETKHTYAYTQNENLTIDDILNSIFPNSGIGYSWNWVYIAENFNEICNRGGNGLLTNEILSRKEFAKELEQRTHAPEREFAWNVAENDRSEWIEDWKETYGEGLMFDENETETDFFLNLAKKPGVNVGWRKF